MLRQRRTRKNRQLSSLSEADKNKLQQMISGANSGVAPHISEHIADGELVPLTPAQKILWYAWKLDPENTTYNLGGALHFEGLLDSSRVNSAFKTLCQKHDALRIKFVEGELQDVWQIDGGDQTFTFFEITATDLAQRNAQLRQVVVQPFDLVEGPLLRVGVVNQGNDSSLLVTLHHIIADGTSMQQLLDEFVAIYVALSEGTALSETDEKVGYLGFAKWLNKQDQQDLYAKQLTIWQELLQADEPLRLPANNQARHAGQYSVKTEIQVLDEPVWHKVSILAKANNVTPYLVLLTAWQVLLSRFANATRVQVGVPVANRHLSETFNLVGFFVNTQAIPLTIEHHESFSSLLDQASHIAKIAQGNQDLPFEHLLKALKPERQTGVHPIFQVMFNYLRRNKKSLQQLGGVALQDFEFYRFGMPFDLQLDVIEEVGQETTLNLMYANELYSPEFAQQCLHTFHVVLSEVLAHIHEPMSQLPLLAEQELQQLAALHMGRESHPFSTSIQQIIHEQSQRVPTAIAVSFEGKTLTYEQLDTRANRLAHCLLAKGVSAEDKVGVLFERSVDMVVSLLAVLKAGAAYVPVDPTLPIERIEYIAKNSGLALFLTDNSDKKFPKLADIAPMLSVETGALEQYEVAVPILTTHAAQLAYVIYTSGSTGNPKGVGNTHEAIYNRIAWQQSVYPLSVDDVVLQKTPFGFDVSVWEFFWPLMFGAKLVVAKPEAHKDSTQLLDVIISEQVTTIHFVPSMLQAFISHEEVSSATSIKRILCSGEALPSEVQAKALQLLPNTEIYNLYGPTEAAVDVSHFSCHGDASLSVPIGKPIDGIELLVLDSALRLSPIGIAGELYIGGIGLARGYLHRSDLTAERFIANPFSNDGARLYRTGDLVYWNEQGQLEYLGRTDHQVKIRGFRIELGEIEAQLRKLAGVNEAVVIADDTSSGKRLVGYLSGHGECLADVEALKTTLATQLPNYMVPSVLVVLPELPTNSNGKIDRKALPKTELHNQVAYAAPEGARETLLAQIWSEVLEIEQVGRLDNFFSLGGDSISSLRLIALAKKHDITLSVQDIFDSTDLHALAQLSLTSNGSAISPLLRAESAHQTLSYAQERQWFLWKLAPESDAYHITGGLILEGMLDFTALQNALDYILEKHDALRTRFVEHQDASVTQVIEHDVKADIQRLDCASPNADPEAFKSGLVRTPFDLTADQLLRVGLVTYANDKHELVVVMHHIASDGWSVNLIIADFVAAYSATIKGHVLEVEVQPRYSDYAHWQKQWLEEGENARQLAYWKANLGDSHPVLELPADLQSNQQEYSNGIAVHAIPVTLKAQLNNYAKSQGSTLFAVLMSAWHILLHRYSGQSDIRVGMPIANRQHTESQGIVGFFVNTQVIRSELSAAMTLAQVVKVITTSLQGAQAHQDLPFEKLVDGLGLERNLNRSPLFQVMLNYQRREENQLSQLSELTISEATLPTNSAQFDLVLEAIENAEGDVTLYLNYAVELYSETRVQALVDGLMSILTEIALHPDKTVSDVAVLKRDVVDKVITLGRGNECEQPKALLHDNVHYHSAHNPNKVALRFRDEVVTYGQLVHQVNRLSAYLQAQNIVPEDRVGVIFSRNVDMVVSLLAIHQAGAAYVPIDPNLPSDRVEYIVKSSALKLILSDGSAAKFAESAQLLNVHVLQDITYASDNVCQRPYIAQDNLAYVIYTSGSTGQPKGVAVTHQGLSNYLSYAQKSYLPNVSSSLVSSTLSFDATVTSLLVPLYSGDTVTLLPSGDEELNNLIKHLQHNTEATLYKITPAHIDAIIASELLTPSEQAHCFVVGGDKLLGATVAQLRTMFPQAQIINEYGPTETVVGCSIFNIEGNSSEHRDVMPITDAIDNTQLYVLSDALTLMPIGVPGELYIAGEGLARGYLSQGTLTAERFIANPFSDEGTRLYRTGDLARWSFDGELEYLGRTDHQVKVRGFRIELGEIEANLCNIDMVHEAVVIADQTELGTQLVAYIVADDEVEYDVLKEILRDHLPSYMIPDVFVTLTHLPLTHNGKVNRDALPNVERNMDTTFVAPEGEQESMLAAIWCSTLGLDQVGRFDNFFELGGDSIVSLQIIAKIRQAGYLITPKQVFEQQTIALLTKHLVLLQDDDLIEQSVAGQVPLLPIQSSFFKKEMVERSHVNQAVMLHSDQVLDEVALNAAISTL
ncbi:amino acid adenylation domain-containing protein, partial [Pseudoalteromonas ostreae]